MAFIRRCLVCLLSVLVPAIAHAEMTTGVFPSRKGDFLEVRGDVLAPLEGSPLGRLEMLVVEGDHLAPIPFQVDERVEVAKGRFEWALPDGPKGGAVKGDGLLGPHDELVLMAADLGKKAGPAQLLELPGRSVELEVIDPIDGSRGFAYLGVADGEPRRTAEDYVNYDVARDYIETPVYSVGHSKVFPIAHNENVVKKEAGGEGVDLIDIFKQRILATAFFGSVTFDKRAKDWTSEISAYKDGPIRVIRKNENHLLLPAGLKSPSLYTHTFYLRELFWFPAEVNVPFKLATVLTSLKIFAATEFCRNAAGMEFTSNSIREAVLIDGVTSPQEKALNRTVNQEWQLVTGPQGTWMNRIVIGPGLEPVHRWLLYEDDSSVDDPPEEENGVFGKIGLSLGNLENLKGGHYTFRSYIHFPDRFRKGDEKKILNMLDAPLRVVVHAL